MPETREQWLERAVEALRPTLIFDGQPRVSVGFPSSGGARAKGSKSIGQCWEGACAADGRAQVYVSPLLGEAVDVLAVLLHELIHYKVGVQAKHGRAFKREMRHVGLEGKATATVPSAQCAATLASLAAGLGEYPHARLVPPVVERKQGTRLLKAQCPACNLVIRITRQWAGENGEYLPICGYCGDLGHPETQTRLILAQNGGHK